MKLSFDRTILWFYWWFFPELIDMVPHGISVYDCIDEHSDYPRNRSIEGLARAATRHEVTLLRGVDISFFVSSATMEQKSPLTRNARYAPNAVDLRVVERALADPATPTDMVGLPRPLIGYAGGVGRRIDFDLVCDMAVRRPDWTFVFVGGAAPVRIPQPNIRFLPARGYPEMLRAIREFDVATVPFVDDRFTRGNNPMKVFDYLAVGKPIVSTALPAVIALRQTCGEVIAVADTPSAWVEAIGSALLREGPAEVASRKETATRHSTDARIDSMMAAVRQVDRAGLVS